MSTEDQSPEEKKSKKPNRNESHIPVLSPTHFKRTGSLKLRNEMRMPHKTEPSSTSTPPLRRHRSLQGLASPVLPRRLDKSYERDDDLDSEKSFGSSCGSLCGHSPFAHNGTTYSARNMKYIFHCSANSGSEEYLTPTQRANRTIKRLRRMLADAQSELIEKDNEISRLTKEVVELRLLKAGNMATGDNYDTGDEMDFAEPVVSKSSPRFMDVLHEELDMASGPIVQEAGEQNNTSTNQPQDIRGAVQLLPAHHSPSLADSGNFEDINCTFAHTLEKELERLRQNYDDMREKHNEKVEQLLKIIADSNDRYYDLKPKHDTAVIRIKELEKEIESLKSNVIQQDELQKTLYLQLYAKQEKVEESVNEVEKDVPPLEDVPENGSHVTNLVEKLTITKKELESVKDNEYKNDALLSAREAISLWILGTRKAMYRALLEASKIKNVNDAEMTLRFLKSAVYYFLTDTSNSRDHLAAIESILGYSDEEKSRIEKVQAWKY
ncbi:protein quick-to-court isoform X2 [Planococcus citri]